MSDLETALALPDLPPAVARLLADRCVVPIATGMSRARVLRCERSNAPAIFLKTAPGATMAMAGDRLSDEVARLRWMTEHALPVPRVRHYEVAADMEYLVLDEVPGLDASVPRESGNVPAVVAELAHGLRLLHATPVADCPFRHDAASRIEEARARVRAGLVDELDFDAERAGRSAADLLVELLAARPASDGAVFTHGDYCLPNVILRDAPDPADAPHLTLAGFVDCGRAGVADPYQDLALAARSLAYNLGAAWVPLLFEHYELADVDEAKLRFYTLLDEFF